jgi:ribosomal protein S18 acetylase RimI-like enzyme
VSQSVVIRDLAADDRSAWAPLWQGYLNFYNSSVPQEVTDATFARLLDPAEPMFALVAERAQGLVGLVQCVIHRSTWTTASYCYLQDLFVSPDMRGGGIGRALIEAVYARADALGLARVYWLTRDTNEAARALYDQVATCSGFIQYRRG